MAWSDKSLWKDHGSNKRTFVEQLDFYEQLSSQFPAPGLRVVYSKAGTNPVAAILQAKNAVIDHGLYWAEIGSLDEAHYLIAILNSETTRKMAEHWQAQGQWGARHFDKVMFNLPIPKFDPQKELHQQLSRAAVDAENVARDVRLDDGTHFIRARGRIREALNEAGISGLIGQLVAQLLSSATTSAVNHTTYRKTRRAYADD